MGFVRERDPLESVASNHSSLSSQGQSGSSKGSSVSSTEGSTRVERSRRIWARLFGSYHAA